MPSARPNYRASFLCRTDRRSQAEIQLGLLLAGIPKRQIRSGWTARSLRTKALYRLVGIGEAVFVHQILLN
jgi:hypothetical protein